MRISSQQAVFNAFQIDASIKYENFSINNYIIIEKHYPMTIITDNFINSKIKKTETVFGQLKGWSVQAEVHPDVLLLDGNNDVVAYSYILPY